MKTGSRSAKPMILFSTLFVGAMVWTAVAGPNVNEQMFQTDNPVPLTSRKGDAGSHVKVVNCNSGEKIAKVLAKAEPGDTIRVTGTCNERVVITTDRLTLDGQGSAILNGGGGDPTQFEGVVTIDGARGVTLQGLTIQNGPGEGILGIRGAAFAVRNTTAQDNASTGIAVSGSSTADLTDCTMRRNGLGLDVFTNSSAILKGAITITDNLGNGVDVNGQSTLEIRGATVAVNNNGEIGIVAGSGQVAIFGSTEAQGSSITANNNGVGGIFLGGSLLTVFGAGSTITVADNPTGIQLGGSLIASPFGDTRGVRFVIENNDVGLRFLFGSGAVFVGGLTVRNNHTTGVLADGADTLTLISAPPNPSAITNNGTDVDLRFGTRVTINGVTIGTITCDGTVLSRGTTVCP
jgi:Right handed beta helix region